jgi:glycosyltransferase involved in cell wall biosynthesis
MPSFTVVMANYNNGPYLDDAIRSVLAQTFTDWELVIVDDRSTDDSVQRIRRYLADQRIRLYPRDKNAGSTETLIHGLSKTSSAIIGILDSDDALAPHAIETAHAVHTERPEVGLVLSQMVICDEQMRPILTTSNTPHHLREPLVWLRGPAHFRTFKKSAYRQTSGLDAHFKIASDWDLMFKLEEVAKVVRVDEALLYHRMSQTSLTRSASGYYRANIEGVNALLASYWRRKYSLILNVPRRVALARSIAGTRYALQSWDLKNALRFSWAGVKIAPFYAATYRNLGRALRALLTNTYSPIKRHNCTGQRLLTIGMSALQSNTGNLEPDRVRCIPVVHKRGHALFGGDEFILVSGTYRASFEMEIKPYSFAQNPIVVLDIYENLTKEVLAHRSLNSVDVGDGRATPYVEFEGQVGQRVEFRVFWGGECFLNIYVVMLELLDTFAR